MHCIDLRASSSRRRRQKKLGPTGSTVILRNSDHVEGKINNIIFFWLRSLKQKDELRVAMQMPIPCSQWAEEKSGGQIQRYPLSVKPL